MKKVLALIIASSLTFNPIMGMVSNATKNDTPEIIAYYEVEVKEGESLWSIAAKYNENHSVKKMIEVIKADNKLDSSLIRTGQILKVRLACDVK